MKYSFDSKYKEREPLETVKIIKKFFNDKGLEIKEIPFKREESTTWFVGIQLFYNQNLIQTANGKGMSKEFALASGYAELYERYCNKISYTNNPFITKRVLDLHYKKYGYFLDPKEKIISVEDALQYDQDFCRATDGPPGALKNFFSYMYDNQFIGVPYENILDPDEKIYYDLRLLSQIRSSTGMAAGNNFYEAFNQGFSEVLEHYITGLYLYDPYDVYYEIDCNSIKNKRLQESIQAIKDHGTDIHFYDFSYNCGFPVIAGVAINKKSYAINIHFGVFPIFEIALERTITELYQGAATLDYFRPDGQIPWKSNAPLFHYGTCSTGTGLINSFPEQIFTKTKIIKEPSSIFLKDREDYSNKDLFEYFKKLCIKNDIKVYYRNNSYTEDMYAISIICPNFPGLTYYQLNGLCENRKVVYDFVYSLYTFSKNIIEKNYTDFNLLYKLLKIDSQLKNDVNSVNLVGQLSHDNWLLLFNLKKYATLDSINKLFRMRDCDASTRDILYDIPDECKYLAYKYVTLYRYSKFGLYSKEEIKNIGKIFSFEYTDEDFENSTNIEYIVDKIFFTSLNKKYKDIKFFEILSEY